MQVTQRLHVVSIATTLSLALAAILVGGTLSPAIGAPATETSEAMLSWQSTYNRLIGEIMSPYCHGLTLDDCPTQGAAELRDEIRAWLVAGRTEDWILDELEMRFGPSILGAPRMRGIGLLAWIVPPLFFFFGTVGVLIYLRRHVMSKPSEEAQA